MKNGFIKVAVATPTVHVADPFQNVEELAHLAEQADKMQTSILVFPELCTTGCTCGDLFFSNTLLNGVQEAIGSYLSQTRFLDLISVIGAPLEIDSRLYNCAVVCQKGEILGIVPKSALSSAEARFFSPRTKTGKSALLFSGKEVPFGSDLLFSCAEIPLLKLAVEFGNEMMQASAMSARHAAAGATFICAPAASCATVGSDDFCRMLVCGNAAKTASAYLFANAGCGESTTDFVFGGHALICENGKVLVEKKSFDNDSSVVCTEIDLERLAYERRRAPQKPMAQEPCRAIPFSLTVKETTLTRSINAHPFIPQDVQERARRCEHILAIQTAGLKQRVERAFAKKLVIGISGGLDSTLALLVMVRTMNALKRSHRDIIAVTMPCFGTTKRTKNNATVLCEELGVDFRTVDIFDAVNLHFRDIGHDADEHNVTYENAQARERTQVLMDIANDCGGMVVGTGDLSELALGWATYNGDHMSMYAVNGSIPKTLVRHLVAFCGDEAKANGADKLAMALRDILDTPVSPELLPAKQDGEIAQKTEDLVGPYELHDFFLYYMLRFGFSPSKIYRLAVYALGDIYDSKVILKWLKIFVRRFFSQQFKRSCMPDGPKVGSVGLSPRGDWQMPSDAAAALWLSEAEKL